MILRRLTILAAALGAFWLLAQFGLRQPELPRPERVAEAGPQVLEPVQERTGNLLGDISLHSADELELLFERLEQRLQRPRVEGEQPLVSLVLHGPEVEFFALKNYAQYKSVVDRAAKLAALGAVDISICRTQMQQFDIGPDEVPSFLRQVPYGPGEVQRLLDEGFVYM